MPGPRCSKLLVNVAPSNKSEVAVTIISVSGLVPLYPFTIRVRTPRFMVWPSSGLSIETIIGAGPPPPVVVVVVVVVPPPPSEGGQAPQSAEHEEQLSLGWQDPSPQTGGAALLNNGNVIRIISMRTKATGTLYTSFFI